MRKIIILSTLMTALFNSTPAFVLAQESSSVSESTVEHEATSLGDFNDQVLPPSTYPATTLPSEINPQELYEGMNEFYKENYTQEEIQKSQTPLSEEELDHLASQFEKLTQETGLAIEVDQVEMTLQSDKLYVPRIIVLENYQKAMDEHKEHDSDLLLTALSELGNRIIMISYYDDSAKEMMPLHLTNRTKPLFYYTR
ncbi:hypothetical protein [Dolosicoccus paucivorans]|uniref:Uncharacterized protein n=1 Tax=Dolosicoccus paucivorans TaxID=84521 RepID=A0A1G8INE4_9LACT|nr:hypothetical protein [Dolosicoccus paucivorans]PMB84915.1 hypothetical protein CJ206_00930 [Dolosicoccus paucivorans]PMC58038.1 hypothetical protein CJ205_06450 [Dolosicoccus paucivorans]SDI20311.1 hypothetical protein SAMN04487994_100183 [Dolosicoccus paucivorans]